jgi:hypothetical protein
MECNTNAVQVKMNEDSWVTQVKECLDVLEEEEQKVKEWRASVFNVPKELMADKPEAYIPQSVSIGPYHHWRSEIYDMERYKLAAAYRFHKRINGPGKFQSVVVEEFKKYDWQIRSCYHKFIDYKEETLAWILALDAVFLLECLQFYVRHADQSSHADDQQLGPVFHPTGTGADDNSILRDLMMLENQLPLFLMKTLLKLQLGSKAKAEERLSILLRLVCQQLSPFAFKLPENSNLLIDERRHLLEVLYYSIVPLSNQNDAPYSADMSIVTTISIEEENDAFEPVDMSTVTQACSLLWKLLSSINVGPVRLLTGSVQFLMKLPLLLALSVFKRLLAPLFNKSARKIVEESSSEFIRPSRDELDIPSVVDLYYAGVKFSPTDGDLTTIQFDKKTATLYLPKIKFDTNTEVILRNLVAFEASAAPGAFVFRRYADFMNGIIDGREDVKLLRECGIICNHLQSDGEVASRWNSLGKCASLTNVAYLDKIIKDLNGYYSRKWKVVVVQFVNRCIFGSWKFLSLLAAAILLIVTCLETYCSVKEHLLETY